MLKQSIKNKRFLIVDHLKQSRDQLKHLALSLGDVRVDTTSFGRDAIQLCNNGHYDVVFLGYDLGEHQKNGQQVLEELRVTGQLHFSTIVIIVTAEVEQAMVLAALEHKPDEYLTKPYKNIDLIKRLDRCMTKKSQMQHIYQAISDKDHKELVTACLRAIYKNSPYSQECYGILSRHYFETKQLEKAREIYDQFKDKKNCQWAKIGLGKLAMEDKNYRVAKEHFNNIIEQNPRYLSAYDWLANVYTAQEEFEMAQSTLEHCLLLSPRSVKRLKDYAYLCLGQHNYQKAADALEKTNDLAINSIHNHPENALMFAEAIKEYSFDLPSQVAKKLHSKAFSALSIMQKHFKQPSLMIKAKLLSSSLYRNSKETLSANDALHQAEKLLDVHQLMLSPEDKFYVSEHLMACNKADRAIKILTTLANENPDDKELLEKVDKIVKQPISNQVKQAEDAIAAANQLYQSNQLTKAIDQLQHAIHIFPDHLGIKLNLLQVYITAVERKQVKEHELGLAEKLSEQLGELRLTSIALERYQELDARLDKLLEES